MAEQRQPPAGGDGIRYRPRGRVVPARDLQAVETGQRYIAAAREEAERLRAGGDAAYQDARRRGFEDGRKEGAAAAARLLAETRRRSDRRLAEVDHEIVDLALLVVRRVLGDMDVDTLLGGVVRHALAEHRQDRRLTLHVAPDRVTALGTDLDRSLDDACRHLITVAADPRLERDQCRLESETGFVELGIEAQLQAIRDGFCTGLDAGAEGPSP